MIKADKIKHGVDKGFSFTCTQSGITQSNWLAGELRQNWNIVLFTCIIKSMCNLQPQVLATATSLHGLQRQTNS